MQEASVVFNGYLVTAFYFIDVPGGFGEAIEFISPPLFFTGISCIHGNAFREILMAILPEVIKKHYGLLKFLIDGEWVDSKSAGWRRKSDGRKARST